MLQFTPIARISRRSSQGTSRLIPRTFEAGFSNRLGRDSEKVFAFNERKKGNPTTEGSEIQHLVE